jgi:hypothetical protein
VLPANLTFNGDEDLRPDGFVPVFSQLQRVVVSISVFNPASSEGVQPGLWVNRLERAELGNRHSSARGNKAFSLEVIIQRDDDDEDGDTNYY